jgi:hypothetical protein
MHAIILKISVYFQDNLIEYNNLTEVHFAQNVNTVISTVAL